MKKNIRGALGNQIMFFEFFFLIISIAVGISIGIIIYFGQGYDFRQVEADMLGNVIEKCVIENQSVLEHSEDFLVSCGLNENALNSGKFFFKICTGISAEGCAENKNYLVLSGSQFSECFLEGTKNNPSYPKCFSDEFSAFDKEYSLIAGSNQKVFLGGSK